MAAGLLQLAVFFVPFFLYVLLRVDSRLIHHRLSTAMLDFSRTWSHLARLASHPGGAVEYAAGHAFLYYVYPWVGALAITATCLAVTLATMWLVGGTWYGWRRAACFLPAAALGALVSRYENPVAFALGLLVALLAANVYLRLGARRPWVRVVAFIGLSAVVCQAAGASFFIYALICGAAELRAKRFLAAGVCIALAAVLPGQLAVRGYGAAEAGLYGHMLPLVFATRSGPPVFDVASRPLMAAVATLLAAYYVAAALLRKPRRVEAVAPGDVHAEPSADRGPAARRVILWSVLTLAALGAAAAVGENVRSEEQRQTIRLDYLFHRKMWPELLEAAATVPPGQLGPLISHDVLRALYHTGRLLSDMFAYPQGAADLTLLDYTSKQFYMEFEPRLYERLADTHYELGRLNDAEHWAQELWEAQGDRPSTLKLLARINIIKGRTEAARIFLRHMVERRNDLEGERWARECLAQLDSDPLLSGDEEIAARRRSLLADDRCAAKHTEEGDLLDLLGSNDHNRMAFEYLMAHYLLAARIDRVGENLHRLDDLDYAGIPRHLEEAMMLYPAVAGRPADLHGRTVSDETVRRFDALDGALRQRQAAGASRLEALRTVAGDYRTSYLHFYLLQTSTTGGGR